MTTIDMTEINQLNDRLTELKNEMKEAGSAFFEKASKQVFDDTPELESFGWTQYTPYFMDGDVCEFGVNADYIHAILNGESVELERSSNHSYDYTLKKMVDLDPDRELTLEEKLGNLLTTLVYSVNEDVMKDLFGDHAKVTVTREGIVVEEYEHD